MIAAVSIISLVIGLGAKVTHQSQSPALVQDVTTRDTTADPPIWQPPVGATWQIDLYDQSLNISSAPKVQVWDVDLDVSEQKIKDIKGTGAKVICYFSAGTQELNRSDSGVFKKDDLGTKLKDWPELWVKTYSENVHEIMRQRMIRAKNKGCDGVDPDNTDAYDNGGGGFTPALNKTDAANYVIFLADFAHSLGLSIGLKNSAGLIENTTLREKMQWAVNEQCTRCGHECSNWQPFITDTPPKPVFHIEYPFSQPTCVDTCEACDQTCRGNPSTNPGTIPPAMLTIICNDGDTAGFSTLMKDACLNGWRIECSKK